MFSPKCSLIGLISKYLLLVCVTITGQSVCQAQVSDIPVETQADLSPSHRVYPVDKRPSLSRDVIVNPQNQRVLEGNTLPIPQSDLLNKRVEVHMSEAFKQTQVESVVRKFDALFSKDINEADSPSDRLLPGLPDSIVIGTSGLMEREGFWQAHLQKTDFELLAKKLSLNDINRFQFRKNRNHGNSLPIRKAGGSSSILILD